MAITTSLKFTKLLYLGGLLAGIRRWLMRVTALLPVPFLLIYASLASVAVLAGDGTGKMVDDHSELSQASVSIGDARIRLPLPGQTTAVVYLTLHNSSSQALTVTEVKVPGSERAELHQHLHENGMMKMRAVESIPVAAGETLEFTPGGYHIMAFEMVAETRQLYPVTLVFADGRQVSAGARVVR
ncbi:copper chaperone PCu(A)C [Aestuariicella sp. G3-2]|uniref:copper chaperone PCu(A)C n=1 Tax=Pseudomaricurvus albidus TaxID=2842452 RepID=UPI001C0BCC5E|nr:copper chaperone PCu(A)C [Aestuariicella albida]MBU3069452.1 copper chaperone PCu(A)C [Aestuariicella albida]